MQEPESKVGSVHPSATFNLIQIDETPSSCLNSVIAAFSPASPS
jgi:hypothetical protein